MDLSSETIQSPPTIFVSANAFTDHPFQVTNLALPKRVITSGPIHIPRSLHTIYQNVTVFKCISQRLQYHFISFPTSRAQEQLFSFYTKIHNIRITQVNADNEFETIRNMVLPVHLHTVAKGEHVPEVERSIRTTKQDTKAGLHGVSFERFPNSMARGLLLRTIIKAPSSTEMVSHPNQAFLKSSPLATSSTTAHILTTMWI